MNTLSKKITATFFTNADGYNALTARWSELMNDKEVRKNLTAAHHLLYLALRGKNWQKGFTVVTNTKALENGAWPAYSASCALRTVKSKGCEARMLAPFAGLVTSEMLASVREWLPECGYYENPLKVAPYKEIVAQEAVTA